MDLLMIGQDEDSNPLTRIYNYNTDTENFEASNTLPGVYAGSSLIAEITGDGLADIFYSGYDGLGQPLMKSFRINAGGGAVEIGSDTVFYQHVFGDINMDGNLDLLKIGKSEFVLISNTLSFNTGPFISHMYPPVVAGEQTIFSWAKGLDEDTPSEAITYDFAIRVSEDSLAVSPANSETKPRYRFVSEHGYMLNDTTFVYDGLLSGGLELAVWGVDNVLNSGGACRGILVGNTVVNSCLELITKDTLVCQGQDLVLTLGAADTINWFSSGGQFISNDEVLNYTANQNEVIYANAIIDDCVINYNLSIMVNSPLIDPESVTLCQNTSFTYSLNSSEWISAQWTSKSGGVVSNSLEVDYTINEPDTLVVEAMNENGCTVQDTVFIDLFELSGGSINQPKTIFIGESVLLEASGGISYSWTPTTGLSNPESPLTQASPVNTTTYTVAIADENGCVTEQQVTVEVRNSVFVPELFTPDSDGNNDVLKVYGRDVSTVQFVIMDREGNKLFETSDPNKILNNGWDGVANGREVPNGTYVWTIKGRFGDGSPLTVLGKNSGSFKLVR